VGDYSEPTCFGEQEKSIHYKSFICTSYCEYKFSALSLRRTGPRHQPQPPRQLPTSASPQAAGATGCTGHRHIPWNSSSTSGPARAPQPRTHKMWTKQPLSSKCHIEDTVLCSFNWMILAHTLLSPGNSCGPSGNKLLCLCKPTKSPSRQTPAREPHLDAAVKQRIPKGRGLTCCPHFLPLALQQPTHTSAGLPTHTASIHKLPVTSTGNQSP